MNFLSYYQFLLSEMDEERGEKPARREWPDHTHVSKYLICHMIKIFKYLPDVHLSILEILNNVK